MPGKDIALQEYERAWTEDGFWRKLGRVARVVGREALEHALVLYYTLRSPHTPVWARTVIIGALGYFISVVDVIPDLTPVLGYTDDVGVMLAALAAVARSVTPEIRARAARQAAALLGDG